MATRIKKVDKIAEKGKGKSGKQKQVETIEPGLQQIMTEEWEAVRAIFNYPSPPKPRLVTDIPNGVLDLTNGKNCQTIKKGY